MKGVCRFRRGVAAGEVETDYVGLSEKDSSGGGGAEEEEEVEKKGKDEEGEEEEEEEGEDGDLELGLSLGAKKLNGGSGKPAAARAWGHGCRILTAKDFPSHLVPRTSMPSSVSSSSAGTKRSADSVSPDAVGSAHQPSQVVVGWPPIRAFRMNSLFNLSKDTTTSEADTHKKTHQNSKNSDAKEDTESRDPDKKGKAVGRFLYIKVNMDGDPIGRKVDLNAHHSYEALALALELMFHNPTMTLTSSIRCVRASKLLDGSSEFALTYEDKDGDWMLVGDVPWGMFLDTVKRLRIMRTSDASGLAPRLQSSNRSAGLIGSNH